MPWRDGRDAAPVLCGASMPTVRFRVGGVSALPRRFLLRRDRLYASLVSAIKQCHPTSASLVGSGARAPRGATHGPAQRPPLAGRSVLPCLGPQLLEHGHLAAVAFAPQVPARLPDQRTGHRSVRQLRPGSPFTHRSALGTEFQGSRTRVASVRRKASRPASSFAQSVRLRDSPTSPASRTHPPGPLLCSHRLGRAKHPAAGLLSDVSLVIQG
jgi:hypothetical protein